MISRPTENTISKNILHPEPKIPTYQHTWKNSSHRLKKQQTCSVCGCIKQIKRDGQTGKFYAIYVTANDLFDHAPSCLAPVPKNKGIVQTTIF